MNERARWYGAASLLLAQAVPAWAADEPLHFTFTNRMQSVAEGKGVVEDIMKTVVVRSGLSDELYGPFAVEGTGGHATATRNVRFEHRSAPTPVYCSWQVSIVVNRRCDATLTCSQYWTCDVVSQRAELFGTGCDGQGRADGNGCHFTFKID